MLSNELKRNIFGKETKMLSNKKAQIGETLTWVVATIIIVVVLLIFIYVSIALGKSKAVDTIKIKTEESSVDWIEVKTNLAYSLNNENQNKINEWIDLENEK